MCVYCLAYLSINNVDNNDKPITIMTHYKRVKLTLDKSFLQLIFLSNDPPA